MSLDPTSRIEPCLLESYPRALGDVIAELIGSAAALGNRLHPITAASLAELVRGVEISMGRATSLSKRSSTS